MKPTPFEVYTVANELWNSQDCHPSNRDAFEEYIDPAIDFLLEIDKKISKRKWSKEK